jgi:hypothetical protein
MFLSMGTILVPQFRNLSDPPAPGPRPRPGRRAGALATAGLIAGALLPLSAGVTLAGPALAASVAGCTPAAGVSCSAKTLTPSLPTRSTPTFQVRQLVQCGSRMYGVGTFSHIVSPDISGHGSVTFRRNNVFSFSATRPYRVTSWNPNVNGEVNSIAVGGTNCSTAYLGGSFSEVHGRTAHNIAAVSTSTGAVLTAFRSDANNAVQTLLLHDSRLLTGGYFTAINGAARRFFVALSPSTGTPSAYATLGIAGNYQYGDVSPNGTRVYNQQLSHGGKRLLVEGDFTSVGGRSRQQVVMLALGRNSATVTPWSPPELLQHCVGNEPFYARAAAWGPGDTSVYVATTGYHVDGSPISGPRSGPCDATLKFPASGTGVAPNWISYTGCDSLYSVVAGNGTVFIGGHERWANNENGCDNEGSGAIPAPGMAGLGEGGGKLDFNPTRARGLGADDLLLTGGGLWIASDNLDGSNMCAHVGGRAGICLLGAS